MFKGVFEALLVGLLIAACGGDPGKFEGSSTTDSEGGIFFQDKEGNYFELKNRDGSDPRNPIAGSDNLHTSGVRKTFLDSRVPTGTIVDNFFEYQQLLGAIFNVPIYCEGPVCNRHLTSPYPKFYLPTWR